MGATSRLVQAYILYYIYIYMFAITPTNPGSRPAYYDNMGNLGFECRSSSGSFKQQGQLATFQLEHPLAMSDSISLTVFKSYLPLWNQSVSQSRFPSYRAYETRKEKETARFCVENMAMRDCLLHTDLLLRCLYGQLLLLYGAFGFLRVQIRARQNEDFRTRAASKQFVWF